MTRIRQADLEALDASITQFRRFLQLPAVRHFVRSRLDAQVDIGMYRLLRAVETPRDLGRTIGDVAQFLDVDASTASRLVDRAVASALLEKRPSEVDRRCTLVHLTDDGRRRLDELGAARVDLWRTITKGWQREEITLLAELLDRTYESGREIGL